MSANTILLFRRACKENVSRLVQLLADDPREAKRKRHEEPLPTSCLTAFAAVKADFNNELVIACPGDEIVGVVQITFIPYLIYQGSWRALIEGLRVGSRFRSRGFGKALLTWVINRAQKRGCHMLQLTTNKLRLHHLLLVDTLKSGSETWEF